MSSSAFANMLHAQWERLHTQVVPLLTRPAVPHLDLNLIYFTTLSVCKIIQTNQSHPQDVNWDGGGPLVSGYYKVCLQQPLLIHSYPKCNSCVALHSVWNPPLPGYEYV